MVCDTYPAYDIWIYSCILTVPLPPCLSCLIRKENRTAVEEGALAGSGISTVISRAGDTFSMADDPLADKLAKGAKRTGLAGTGLSTFASIVSAGSGDSSWTHAGVNGVADLGLAAMSVAGGLPGSVAALAIDGSGLKGAGVERATVAIESLRVDEVINEVNINDIVAP